MPGPAYFSVPRLHLPIRPEEAFKMSPNHPVTERKKGKTEKSLVAKTTCLDIKFRGITGKLFFHLYRDSIDKKSKLLITSQRLP